MKKIFILAFIVLSCSKKPFEEPRDKYFTLKVTASEGGSVDTTEGTYTESTTVTLRLLQSKAMHLPDGQEM